MRKRAQIEHAGPLGHEIENAVFLHISQSKSGFSVSDPTYEAAGRGWRGGDRKAALALANVQELHSHLGSHFYDRHRPHHRPRCDGGDGGARARKTENVFSLRRDRDSRNRDHGGGRILTLSFLRGDGDGE